VSPVEKNGEVEYFTFNPIPVTGFWTFNTLEGACITKDPAHLKSRAGLYVPDETVNVVRPEDVLPEKLSNLFGKSVTFNGDSICAGAGYAGGYGKIIADRFSMEYENVAVNGGTIAAETYKESTGAARHWISRSVGIMNEEADYAILEGGVNDSSLGVPLGTISVGYNSTLDDTTFYGAFECMLKQLVTRFAGKKYGYIAVHQAANNFRIINDAETSYYWAAKRCCEKWGVPFLDLNGTLPPFNFFSAAGDPKLYALRTTYTNNGDGWHPTEAGYNDYYVPKIVKWMESL
jgi:lysophospholipase L1-like esterase